jgi:hypothetical protein
MSLLACLNEQAVKEISDEGQDLQIGQQRLLKAYKIIVETKNPRAFDSNYKAIICYNLACSYQMQGGLGDCSKYLQYAIAYIDEKLDALKSQTPQQHS